MKEKDCVSDESIVGFAVSSSASSVLLLSFMVTSERSG